MTSQTDLDRLLGTFFDEGPTRAPDAPLDAALAHAAARPRRPDPLRALRRDPMGRPWFAGTGGMRALPLVAAIGLLLVAAFAAAAVGGWFDRDPGIVVPTPSETPAATPSATVTPTARTFDVDLIDVSGADATMEITDRSGTLVAAVSGTPADGGSVAEGIEVTAVDSEPASVQLTWTLGVCETEHTLDIAEDGRTLVLTAPSCEGDAFPRDLTVILTFRDPVAPADLDVTLAIGE